MYTNHRGISELRRAVPTGIEFFESSYYPEDGAQWFVVGWCLGSVVAPQLVPTVEASALGRYGRLALDDGQVLLSANELDHEDRAVLRPARASRQARRAASRSRLRSEIS